MLKLLAPLLYLLPTLASADQVVLQNGDTLTGSIVKKDGNKLTFKSEFLGQVTMRFSQIRATARINGLTDTIASAIRGGWTYNRDLTPRVFVTTLNDYDHDRFQQLDLRFVAGGGFGLNAVKNESTVLSFSGIA